MRTGINGLQGTGIISQDHQSANTLHKAITRTLQRRKIYSSCRVNNWVVDLAGVKLISKYKRGIKPMLCVVDVYSKYALVVLLKHKKDNHQCILKNYE